MAIAVCQTSKTPYTVAQLAQKYTTIKGLLNGVQKPLKFNKTGTEAGGQRVSNDYA
jgi:hypothetical protein